MSAHQQGHYDDNYGHQQHGNTDSYYQDEHGQYYDHNGGYEHGQGGDGYYDEAQVPASQLPVELEILTTTTVVTTMRMPTALTSTRVATMRAVTTIKMTTTMTDTMSKDNKLLVSTPDTQLRADAEETRRRARRPSATSP
jgi:hypothetical protein